jgi:2-furoyl-CoA dehydrogenase 2Fe-2S iron sulfur subunit
MRRLNRKTRMGFALNERAALGDVEPRMLLANFLRQVIGATGTNVGCEHGVCDCYTLLIDGVASRSCLTLAVRADRRRVDMVESLATSDDRLNLLQAIRLVHPPGVLMSFADCLARNPDPSEDEVPVVLGGHICRCTGYAGIIAAVLDVAERMRQSIEPDVRAARDRS